MLKSTVFSAPAGPGPGSGPRGCGSQIPRRVAPVLSQLVLLAVTCCKGVALGQLCQRAGAVITPILQTTMSSWGDKGGVSLPRAWSLFPRRILGSRVHPLAAGPPKAERRGEESGGVGPTGRAAWPRSSPGL